MAGHRRGTGKPTRAASRSSQHLNRVRSAPSGEAQVAAAWDYWRSVAYRSPERQRLLHEQATQLVTDARRLEGSAV